MGCGTTAPSIKRNDDTLGWQPTECCCLPPASLLRANTHFKNLSYIYIALFDSIRRVYFGVIFKGLPFVKMPMSDTVLGVSLHIGSRPANFLDVHTIGKEEVDIQSKENSQLEVPLNGPCPSLAACSSASLVANRGLFPSYECLGWVLCSSKVLPPIFAFGFAIFPACAVQRSPGVERGVL